MEPRTWTSSDPSTRVADEEDVVGHLAWPRDWDEDPGVSRAQAIAGLRRLVRLGLPFREELGIRRYDPYEVFFFMRWAHHRLGDPLWDEALAVARRYPAEYLPVTDSITHFDLLFEREVNLDSRRPGSLFRTHLPLPVGDGGQRAVTVGLMKYPDVRCQRDDAVLDVRAAVPEESPRLVHFGVTISLTVGWRGEVIDPMLVEPLRAPGPADRPFLVASEGPIRVTDRIRALSIELSGDARTPWDVLRSFWRFLFARVAIGRIHPHTLSANDPLWSVIETGRSDCYYGSALLVALCRARGIPARLVSGYFLYHRSQANHFWMELLVPPYGWVPCDLWSWILADGDVESEWGQLFLGRVDPRLVIERFPRTRLIFDLPLSRPSYALQRPCSWGPGPGVELILRDLSRNDLICRDRLCLRARDQAPRAACAS